MKSAIAVALGGTIAHLTQQEAAWVCELDLPPRTQTPLSSADLGLQESADPAL